MIEVYQAEWCPHSRRIRQRLTELGIDYIARQVEPDADDRRTLREATGCSTIPVVVLEDGTVLGGEDEVILAGLDERFPEGPHAEGHRHMEAIH
jgi:glutaredoxin